MIVAKQLSKTLGELLVDISAVQYTVADIVKYRGGGDRRFMLEVQALQTALARAQNTIGGFISYSNGYTLSSELKTVIHKAAVKPTKPRKPVHARTKNSQP